VWRCAKAGQKHCRFPLARHPTDQEPLPRFRRFVPPGILGYFFHNPLAHCRVARGLRCDLALRLLGVVLLSHVSV
jgi:hypothetical protein